LPSILASDPYCLPPSCLSPFLTLPPPSQARVSFLACVLVRPFDSPSNLKVFALPVSKSPFHDISLELVIFSPQKPAATGRGFLLTYLRPLFPRLLSTFLNPPLFHPAQPDVYSGDSRLTASPICGLAPSMPSP